MACMNILIKINRKYEKIQESIYVQKFRSVLLLTFFDVIVSEYLHHS
jgi:hypothetical protein